MKQLLYIMMLLLCLRPLGAREIRVRPGGEVSSLNAALRLAEDGDRIVIDGGVYREAVVVDKSVEIAGINHPLFDGEGQRQIFIIRAGGVRVSGLTFRNCGISFIEDRSAILIDGAPDCTVEGNRFINNFFAVYISKAAGTRILNNLIQSQAASETSSGNGIHAWYCKDVTISGNTVSGHRDGIYFEFVQNGLVDNNHSEANLRYGLHFMFSDRCRYLGNIFRRNGAGVAVMYTKNVEMQHNRFEENWGSAAFGLLLKDITDSEIRSNLFLGNSIGIYAENSNRLEISGNDFLENGWAVKIMSNSMDNHFSGNNFIANSFDVATNSRQNFSRFEKNFWSGYRGYDLDRDGYGDVPFHPVRLFSMMVAQNPPALVMMRSLLVDLLDLAESVFPMLTPETLIDEKPLMRRRL